MLTTEPDGSSPQSIRYYPFGEIRSTSPSDTPPVTDRLFTGQILDDTGLYYFNARYYDPEIGRFISPDSIVPYPDNPQSLNRYSYCVNNPLKYVDPNGNFAILPALIWIGKLAFTAAVASVAIDAGFTAIPNALAGRPTYEGWNWGDVGKRAGIAAGITVATGGFGAIPAISRALGRVTTAAVQKFTRIPGLSGYFSNLAKIRQGYLNELGMLSQLTRQLHRIGYSDEVIAKWANKIRLDLATHYKHMTPPGARHLVYARNIAPEWLLGKGYDSIYGPSYNWFKNQGYQDVEIWQSASRSSSWFNKVLGLE